MTARDEPLSFEQVYLQFIRPVYIAAYGILQNQADAEDVAHDVFLNYFQVEDKKRITSYNTVYANTTTLNSSYPTTYGIGTVVYKKGDGMSTVESGAVQCNNYSVTFNNVTITDLVKAGYYRAGGDSGGIVFTAPSGGYASPAGIHMGGLTTTSEHYGFFTKMYNALAALQSGPLTYSLY